MSDEIYLSKLLELRSNFSIKLITGFRGTGKLELLRAFIERLKSEGIADEQIVFINFEIVDDLTDFQKLYNYVNDKIENQSYAYLLFYGIQRVKDWEKAVNAFFLGAPVEIYIADSNEKLLTEKIFQLLPNNCDVLKMYPLSFSQYLKSLSVDINELDNLDNFFNKYLHFGGMPVISEYPVAENILRRLLTGLLNESMLKDVVIRYSLRNSYLFQRIMKFLALNLSYPIRLKNLEKYFTEMNSNITLFTLDNYLNLMDESGFFTKIPRYDLKKNIFVNGNECFYCADNGLCNALLDFDSYSEAALIKNSVCLELLRRGYKVYSPIIGTMTADFFAVSDDKKLCIQVMPTDDRTLQGKLLRPLHKLSEDIERILISKTPKKLKGNVRNILITDFLLHNDCY